MFSQIKRIINNPKLTFLIFALVLCFIYYHQTKTGNFSSSFQLYRANLNKIFSENTKFILIWTSSGNQPLHKLKDGFLSFVENKCKHTNCYISHNKRFLSAVVDYHAIVFYSNQVVELKPEDLPPLRDNKQKYIFSSLDSSHNYPACSEHLNNYFNWTWTYRLDSDIQWRTFTIYNKNNDLIAPRLKVKWHKVRRIIDKNVTNILRHKSKAIAWFVSKCKTKSKREEYVKSLSKELVRFGITVDVYGKCGNISYSKNIVSFKQMLKKDYFFYLAFEDSFSADFVSEEVLLALNGYAVPIVYGSAEYTRFLPPDSFLNSVDVSVKNLAEIINSTLHNKTEYENFFKWRNYYVYKRSIGTDICNLCEIINNHQMFDKESLYKNFVDWWNPSEIVNCVYRRGF